MERVALLLTTLLLAGSARAGPEPGKVVLTVEQAVQVALAKNPSMRLAGLGVEAAEAGRKQARARFGPTLQFEMRAMYFNEPPGFDAGGMDSGLIDQLQQIDDLARAQGDSVDQALSGALLGFGQSMLALPDMFASENYDVTVSVRLAQPLSQLWAIYQAYQLAELDVDIAKVAGLRARSRLGYQVRQACLQLLTARAGVAALQEAQATVAAHVERAGHFVEVGLIGKNDLLQARARLAELQSQLIAARHGLRLSRARLAMLLDLPVDTEIDLQQPPGDDSPEPPLAQVVGRALAARPEMRELQLRIRQAEHGVKASWQGFIPGVTLLGQYQHNEGSLMIPPAWTVGVMVDFNVWEWGASYYALEQARVRLQQARTALGQLRRGIELEVRAAWLKLRQTREQIAVARTALEAAAEQLRLERQRYEVQQSTSTDVLDAQSRLTQAKMRLESARYQHLLARAALRHASGQAEE